MAETKLNNLTTLIVGEEHPSTLPVGEEDFAALAIGEDNGRGGPFGAF
jgi:hypothetical protein